MNTDAAHQKFEIRPSAGSTLNYAKPKRLPSPDHQSLGRLAKDIMDDRKNLTPPNYVQHRWPVSEIAALVKHSSGDKSLLWASCRAKGLNLNRFIALETGIFPQSAAWRKVQCWSSASFFVVLLPLHRRAETLILRVHLSLRTLFLRYDASSCPV